MLDMLDTADQERVRAMLHEKLDKVDAANNADIA